MLKQHSWRRTLLIAAAYAGLSAAQRTGGVRVERIPVANGGELLVLRQPLPPGADGKQRSIPLLATLRDTLGDSDPDNDRLRYVWSLTYNRPTWLQKVASALPFFYWRVGHGAGAKPHSPQPILDLARTERPVWETVVGNAGQVLLLDSQGAFFRSSTRAFRGNAADHRRAHLMEALSSLEAAEDSPALTTSFTPQELEQLEARLGLATQPFGGLVSNESLAHYVARMRTDREEMRGRNWELLRQRAEAEGLLFQPLFDGPNGPSYALLSVSRTDLANPPSRPFQRQFLSISDPWHDNRLKKQTGETIPLALYALDHPRSPLLVVDFRSMSGLRRREVTQRAITDFANGVMGVSMLGNWYFYVGRASYDFVRTRHGAARDRAARVRAFEQLRMALLLDESIDPAIRAQVEKGLNSITINPLEGDAGRNERLAEVEYQLLMKQAQNPKGLPARLEKDRREELVAQTHGRKARVFFHTANLLSFGQYTHREPETPAVLAQVKNARLLATHRQILAQALAQSPALDVTMSAEAVKRSVSVLGKSEDPADAQLIGRVFRGTADADTRKHCLHVLARNGSEVAREELDSLANDVRLTPEWRAQTSAARAGDAGASGSAGSQ